MKTWADYFIETHQGTWRKAKAPFRCCGWAIDPEHGCEREIAIGEHYLSVVVAGIALCSDCARKDCDD